MLPVAFETEFLEIQGCSLNAACLKSFSSLSILHRIRWNYSQFSHSVVSDCNPVDCSTPGLPVRHQLSELAQTHVHWVGDAIKPSHPLSSTSPSTFNLSQHQGLFQWLSSLHQVAQVLSFKVFSFILLPLLLPWIPCPQGYQTQIASSLPLDPWPGPFALCSLRCPTRLGASPLPKGFPGGQW